MDSKAYRLREFINPQDNRSLILDASAGLSLGPLPGLEQFSTVIQPSLSLVDGLVASPGQAGRLPGRTRNDAALLVRGDWTNALRDSDFVLPPETTSHIPLLDPASALDLGASAIVIYFLLGFEEQIEADCLRETVQLALQGAQVNMPLVVDVQAVGPRVVLRQKAIELGVSYALEGGADGVAIPWPGGDSFETILAMAAGLPIWIKPTDLGEAAMELEQALDMGGTGLWLDHRLFAAQDPFKRLIDYSGQIHLLEPAG